MKYFLVFELGLWDSNSPLPPGFQVNDMLLFVSSGNGSVFSVGPAPADAERG